MSEPGPGSPSRGVAVEAAARLDSFLRNEVETPLAEGMKADDPEELRSAVERALAAIQNLHFLADRAAGERSLHDFAGLVEQALERYQDISRVSLRLSPPGVDQQVRVDAEAFGDALFLVLHNAEQFGTGEAVDVKLTNGETYASVVVADRGPGFTAEALSRAYDPFYSTSEQGLGLGLPQARHLMESMGGEIHLRNGAEGGVVELLLPVA